MQKILGAKSRRGQTAMPGGVSWQVGAVHVGGWSMRSKTKEAPRTKAENAWRMAASCSALAQEADGQEEREYYVRMRDAWIGMADRCEFLDLPDARQAVAT